LFQLLELTDRPGRVREGRVADENGDELFERQPGAELGQFAPSPGNALLPLEVALLTDRGLERGREVFRIHDRGVHPLGGHLRGSLRDVEFTRPVAPFAPDRGLRREQGFVIPIERV
jgi:hypothetical protein